MDLGALDADGYYRLLRKLEGSGYCKDDDSVRGTELMAVAKMAAMVTETLSDSFANLFLISATTGLDLIERTMFLVQSSSLTVEERRARLIAFRQGAWLVEARLSNSFATYLGDATGSTQRPGNVEATAHRAAPGSAFLVARREPAAITKRQIRDLEIVLARGLAGRAISGGVTQRDATWGDALEPAGIAITPAVTIPAQTKARTAPLPFHPGSAMSREAWIELQSLLAWKSHGFSINQTQQGRTVMLINASLAASGSVLIDGPTANSSINWSHRIVQAWGVASTSAVTDPSAKTAAENVWLAPSKTGVSGAGYVHKLLGCDTSATDSTLTLDIDGSGNLRLNNTGGSTLHVTLMVRCTPVYTAGSTTDTQPWMNADQAEHDDLAELYAAQLVTDGGAVGKFASVDAGALRRVVYSGPLSKAPIAGIPQGVSLDTSEDWRNRYVLVVPLATFSGGTGIDSTYPVPSSDGMLAPPIFQFPHTAAARLFYTGSGVAPGSATQQPNQASVHLEVATGQFWLFADTTGALHVEMKDASTVDNGAWMGLIIASERTDGSSVVTPVPVHATQVQTFDLEAVQSVGTYQQGRQGNVPRRLLTDAAPKAIPTCSPLGLHTEGAFPARPVSWMVRERLGATDDGAYEERQPIFGQRKRVVSLTIPTGTSRQVDDFNLADELAPGVNDQIDMRDRIVWIEGRWSTTDITVNAASQASDASSGQFVLPLYTGPYARIFSLSGPIYIVGHRATFDITGGGLDVEFEFSRAGVQKGIHSVVRINNATGATVYLNLVVEVSGKLGLCDSRAYGVV